MPHWYVLIHNIPPRPLYLRAKIRQRLEQVGAIALKNSVYVLPNTADCLEDFQWIAQETISGGGTAHVLEADFTDAATAESLVKHFNAARDAEYESVTREAKRKGLRADERARLAKRFDEIRRRDFFASAKRAAAEKALARAERKEASVNATVSNELQGRTWVTRPHVKIDRMATAWLVRRFIDPKARIRFADPKSPRKGKELRFDMLGGDFTHEEDRCTFETVIRRTGLDDPAVQAIAEIVHDIDLKDAKYQRAEVTGVRAMVEGIVARHDDDKERLDRGFALFDDLYAALRG